MSSAKTIKVKDLAGKYGLSPKDVIRELNEQGFDDVKSASSAIPAVNPGTPLSTTPVR